jgi:hypothetical protein
MCSSHSDPALADSASGALFHTSPPSTTLLFATCGLLVICTGAALVLFVVLCCGRPDTFRSARWLGTVLPDSRTHPLQFDGYRTQERPTSAYIPAGFRLSCAGASADAAGPSHALSNTKSLTTTLLLSQFATPWSSGCWLGALLRREKFSRCAAVRPCIAYSRRYIREQSLGATPGGLSLPSRPLPTLCGDAACRPSVCSFGVPSGVSQQHFKPPCGPVTSSTRWRPPPAATSWTPHAVSRHRILPLASCTFALTNTTVRGTLAGAKTTVPSTGSFGQPAPSALANTSRLLSQDGGATMSPATACGGNSPLTACPRAAL